MVIQVEEALAADESPEQNSYIVVPIPRRLAEECRRLPYQQILEVPWEVGCPPAEIVAAYPFRSSSVPGAGTLVLSSPLLVLSFLPLLLLEASSA